MVFKDNGGGVDNEKSILHAKNWDFYMENNKDLIKGGYCVEVSGYGGNRGLWWVLDYLVVD